MYCIVSTIVGIHQINPKSIQSFKQELKYQESVQKDVEKAFGGLQSKTQILICPVQFLYEENIKQIVLC